MDRSVARDAPARRSRAARAGGNPSSGRGRQPHRVRTLWWMDLASLALLVALAAAPRDPVPVRYAPGTLHGFPSMSDPSGRVIADGELTQEVSGDRVVVHARWRFADGRLAEERDELRVGAALTQERYSWVEIRAGQVIRRFEVDFSSGQASATTLEKDGAPKRERARLELPQGRAFAGYGVAMAVSQLGLAAGARAELTLAAFTPAPRAVQLEVRREEEERLPVAGRPIPCDRYTLHPVLPFPVRLFVHPKDAHLWFTRAAPPALVRAEQGLVAKGDPRVVIDVTPRGAARAPAAARSGRR